MKRFKIKPHVFVLVVGALVMVGAFASGIFPRITEWHDDSPVAREVFVNIPDPLYWAFYTTVPVMLLMVAYLVSLRFRNYERGAADDRRTTKANRHKRIKEFRKGVWMQSRAQFRYRHRDSGMEVDGIMRHIWLFIGDEIAHFELFHDSRRMRAFYEMAAVE